MDDLEHAITSASRHLGVEAQLEEPDPTIVVWGPRNFRLPVLVGLLIAMMTGTGYLFFRPATAPPPEQVEMELRWSVQQVVTRVEVLRARTGRLPEAGDLFGVLTESVEYDAFGSQYLVTATAWGVSVTYDGSMPLDSWVDLATHSDSL